MNTALLVFGLLGSGLTVLGHWLGSRSAAASAPVATPVTPSAPVVVPSTPAPSTDPFAGLPGFTGHPLLNLLASFGQYTQAQQQQAAQAAVGIASLVAAHPASAAAVAQAAASVLTPTPAPAK